MSIQQLHSIQITSKDVISWLRVLSEGQTIINKQPKPLQCSQKRRSGITIEKLIDVDSSMAGSISKKTYQFARLLVKEHQPSEKFRKMIAKNMKFEKLIQENDTKLMQRDSIIAQQVKQIKYFEEKISQLIKDIEQKDKVIKQTKQVIILANQIIHSLEQEYQSNQLQIARLKVELSKRDHRIAEYIKRNSQNQTRIILLYQQSQLQTQTLVQRTQTIKERNQIIADQSQSLSARHTLIFLKAQFLFGPLIGLICISLLLALGWKQPNQRGQQKVLALFAIFVIVAGIWGISALTAIGIAICRQCKVNLK